MSLGISKVLKLLIFLSISIVQVVESVNLIYCGENSESVAEIVIPYFLSSTNESLYFNLSHQNISCHSESSKEIQISLISLPDEEEDSEEVPKFSPQGLLEVDKFYYRHYEYCISSINESTLAVQICEVSCAENTTSFYDQHSQHICIPKCCPFHKILSYSDEDGELSIECTDGTENQTELWTRYPLIYNNHSCADNGSSSSCPTTTTSLVEEHQFHFHQHVPGCDEDEGFKGGLDLSDTAPFKILPNSSVKTKYGEVIHRSDYCFENAFRIGNPSTQVHLIYKCIKLCPENVTDEDEENLISTIYTVAMFISAFFLLLTIIVYIVIWERHNIHGWVVFSLSVTLFFLFTFLAISRIMSRKLDKENSGSGGCVLIGLITHFFSISTFCWLTTLSFDLWWTLRSMSPSVTKQEGIIRYRMYSAFAVGLPFAFIMFGFILDKLNTDNNFTSPKYGTDCSISNKTSKGYFVFLPVAILLVSNICFFASTIYTMFKHRQNTKAVRGKSTKQKQMVHLFAKLFIIMGVTWSFEVIEYLANLSEKEKDELGCTIHHSTGKIWILIDLINIAQGILIFLIFVCKKQIIVQLYRKHDVFKGKSKKSTQRTTTGLEKNNELENETINKVILAPILLIPACKLNQFDMDRGSGRTEHSSVSMRQYSTTRGQTQDENIT